MSGNRRRRKPTAPFKKGEEVEVRLDGRGFKDAWYEARVLRYRPERRRYSVVYDCLANEADESRPLREAVGITHVRPRPPRGGGGRFALVQLVDAFYNDGWWSGVVSRVPAEQEAAGRYAVRFPNTGEEIEFGPSELRPRQEWLGGEWVAPELQDKFIKPQKLGGARTVNCKQSLCASSIPHKSKVPHTNRSLRGDDDDTPCNSHIYGTNSEIKNTEGSIFQSQLESSQVCKKSRKGETIDDDTRLIDCLTRCTKISSRVKKGFNVTMPTKEKRPNFHLKTFLIDKFHCSTSPFKEKSAGSPNVATETPSITLLGEVHDEPLTPTKFIQESLVQQTPLSVIETSDGGGELARPGGEGNDQQRKALGTQDQLQQGKVPRDSGVRKHAAGKKRKRKSIPRKVTIIDTKGSSEGDELEQLDDTNDAIIEREYTRDEVDVSAIPGISHGNEESNHEVSPSTLNHEGMLMSKMITRDEVDVSAIVDSRIASHGNEESTHGVSPSTLNHEGILMSTMILVFVTRIGLLIDFASCVGDSVGDRQDRVVNEPSTEGHSTSQTEAVTRGYKCIKGSEGKVLSSMMLGTSNSLLLGTSNFHSEHNEAGSEAQNEPLFSTSGVQVATSTSGKKSSSKNSYLPFEKCSAMWETIESMEVISKMLQQPHFRPLEQYCEGFREGMAIGLMVTYSNLVNSIGDLKMDDSHYKFDENTKTLVHLEGHGFDVQHLRAHVEELRRIKSDHEQLVEKSSALEVLILEKEKERDWLNAETETVEEVIMDLKQTLAHFYERKTSILKQQEENASDMIKLQMDARIAEEGLQLAERDFESFLSAAW